MDPIDMAQVKEKSIELDLKKKHLGIKKLLFFDLDETLAHCVRDENPENYEREPDVELTIKVPQCG